MKLSTFFSYLTSGEFRNHTMGTDLVNNNLAPKWWPTVIPLLNLALLSVSTKFLVYQKEVVIDLFPYLSKYVIQSKHNQSDTSNNNNVRFIADTLDDPFTDDIVKILGVTDELGRDLYLNDSNQAWSVFVKNINTVVHPYPKAGNSIGVSYQATLPLIDNPFENLEDNSTITDLLNPEQVDMVLPLEVLELVLYFIGSRIHTAMSGQESMALANFFLNKYKQEKGNILINPPGLDINNTDTSIRDEGFY